MNHKNLPEETRYFPIVAYWKAFAEVYGLPWWAVRRAGIRPGIKPEAAEVMANDIRRTVRKYRAHGQWFKAEVKPEAQQ